MKGLPYFLGIATVKSISAVLFLFHPGKNADRATVNACTGWVRHIGRFYESRAYTFSLDAQLSKGDVEVLLLDQKKQPLLKLSRQLPTQTINLDTKSRYYLRWEFQNASGKCALRW